MDPAIAILLAVVVCFMGLSARAKSKLDEKIDKVNEHYAKVDKNGAVLETKVDMLLHQAGFDVRLTNKEIDEHMEELKKNDRPKLGCIDITKLYRKKEG